MFLIYFYKALLLKRFILKVVLKWPQPLSHLKKLLRNNLVRICETSVEVSLGSVGSSENHLVKKAVTFAEASS